jgi:chromate transporter
MMANVRAMAVEKKGWLDEESFRQGVALCQTIPGATVMQACAYVGLRVRGVPGALVSFVGFGLPAFLFMMVLSSLYVRASSLPAVVSIFNGLRVITVAIVAHSFVSFGRTYLKKWTDTVIALIAAGIFGLEVSPIVVILLAGLLGMLFYRQQTFPKGTVRTPDDPLDRRYLLAIMLSAALGLFLLLVIQHKLFDLAVLMLRIDLFAFGGGLTSVPLLFHEVVDVRSWMDGSTFLSGIALGQITPGPIVVTATFVGYVMYGVMGAIVATISVFLPSILLLIGIVPYFDRLRASPYFNRAVEGILFSFVGLLLIVAIRFALYIPWDAYRIVLVFAAFVALLLRVNIVWVVLVGTVVSWIIL